MGKKGNWLSALKRAFTSSSKDSSIYTSEKKYAKEKKKWGLGKSKHGETNTFIPLYREPSSIEKILGDAERDQQHQRNYQEPPKRVQNFNYSTNQDTPKKVQHSQAPSQEPPKRIQHVKAIPRTKPSVGSNRRAITPSYAQISAIRIQSAYRGYMARKNYRALKGLVRLQRVMRGQSVKRQTTNTMKCMQLLVRVQSQIRTRRLQMIDSKNLQQQLHTPGRSEKEMDNFSRWSKFPKSEAGGDDEWDDSVLTKEERDARTRRKVEAVIKRERALAYAYSQQLLKVTPKSAHAVLTDIRSGSFPWWWNWLDRQLPQESYPAPPPKTPTLITPRFTNFTSNTTQLRPNSHYQSKRDISEAPTPRSVVPSPRAKNPLRSSNKWNHNQLRDDESLTSCPAFRAVPNYMVPTVSAKAKVRDSPGTTRNGHDEGKKKFSFSLNQSIGSLRWSKGPLFTGKETKGKHWSTNSIGGMSVDSTVSLPVGVGRKPFK